jgi:N,N'-diacetyllegionaminate synthase
MIKKKYVKPYLIAEIAQTHEGSVGLAHAFIKAVAHYGADAVKFQVHIAEEESSPEDEFRSGFKFYDDTRYDYWKRIEFDKNTWINLKTYAKSLNLDFIVSVFSLEALHLILQIGVDYIKLGSGEIFNPLLLSELVNQETPVILSTGLSSFDEIQELLKKFSKKDSLSLMQCTSSYPTKLDEIGVNVIEEFNQKFSYDIGFSDHSGSVYPSLAAYSMGARFFEVHVTMHKEMYGPDVSSSITLEQLRELREGLDSFYEIFSHPVDKNKEHTSKNSLKTLFTKSYHYASNLSSGHVITIDNLKLLKPNIGIPYDQINSILGKTLKFDVKLNQRVDWKDLLE